MHFEYCPYCGKKLELKEIGDEGMLPYCAQCKTPLWDMFTTSVICAVVNEKNEIALLRQDYVSKTNYVCVAGILKLGESAEEAAKREINDEIGQKVSSLTYIRSYYYKKKEMLMLGFLAKVEKSELVLSGEVDTAEWFPLAKALKKLREGGIAWQLVKEILDKRM